MVLKGDELFRTSVIEDLGLVTQKNTTDREESAYRRCTLQWSAGMIAILGGLLGLAIFLVLCGMVIALIQAMVRGVVQLLFALIYVVGPAVLGLFIVTLGLQIVLNLGSPNASADPTMPGLSGLLAFCIILTLRVVQWRGRADRNDGVVPSGTVQADVLPSMPVPPRPPEPVEADDPIASAWTRALKLAPERQEALMKARGTCAALLAATDHPEGIPQPEITETAVLIRHHLAPYVDGIERRLEGAAQGERATIIAEMTTFLLGFADRAARALTASGPDLADEDLARQAHLSAQLFG
jgi:hypothetical protein